MILCSRSVAGGEKAIESEIKEKGEGNYVVSDTSNVRQFLSVPCTNASRLQYLKQTDQCNCVYKDILVLSYIFCSLIHNIYVFPIDCGETAGFKFFAVCESLC